DDPDQRGRLEVPTVVDPRHEGLGALVPAPLLEQCAEVAEPHRSVSSTPPPLDRPAEGVPIRGIVGTRWGRGDVAPCDPGDVPPCELVVGDDAHRLIASESLTRWKSDII